MQYMLLIYDDEKRVAAQSSEEREAVILRYRQYAQAVKDAGIWVAADPLESTATATSVRVRNGERLITDGPFAETQEQLAGYFVVDVPNLDVALDWAAKIPGAEWGTVEVRPVWTAKRDATILD